MGKKKRKLKSLYFETEENYYRYSFY